MDIAQRHVMLGFGQAFSCFCAISNPRYRRICVTTICARGTVYFLNFGSACMGASGVHEPQSAVRQPNNMPKRSACWWQTSPDRFLSSPPFQFSNRRLRRTRALSVCSPRRWASRPSTKNSIRGTSRDTHTRRTQRRPP
jgi:hypothetical protein